MGKRPREVAGVWNCGLLASAPPPPRNAVSRFDYPVYFMHQRNTHSIKFDNTDKTRADKTTAKTQTWRAETGIPQEGKL
ncbi:hypothetical protein BaRGS_00011877 [Batillaria attramentaria]|uniref:Uncharacterized protein n=1 Tax=Batillaria attramentaria TaxID=370345 RepID=A0ABD0LBX2_9CAEN